MAAPNEIVRLYSGAAPGSEDWSQVERESVRNLWKTRLISNVVEPTLTVFRPDPAAATGRAVVICPGGGFFALSIDSEGFEVARALNEEGITCFVLKYRLVETLTSDPPRELEKVRDLDSTVAPIVELAMTDGLRALGHVRENCSHYKVRSDRIGILGFSAGGSLACSVAHCYEPETRPDFVGLLYPVYRWAKTGRGIPKDAPPLFVLAATDDALQLAPECVDVYRAWVESGKSAELHLYAAGDHGFGMRQQGLPSDQWIGRYLEWICWLYKQGAK